MGAVTYSYSWERNLTIQRKTLTKMALRPSERSVLHLLRLHGATSKAELARLSDMSAQGISVIVDRLLDLELVKKGSKQRGRVGQPSTPISLSPDGAVSIGIFIGRDEAEMAVADFTGEIIESVTVQYDDATDPSTPALLYKEITALARAAEALRWQRHVGIGIAANEGLLKYYVNDKPSDPFSPSRSIPLATQLENVFDVPVHCVNDIRAACLAEMTLGDTEAASNVLYLSLGMLFGSGIILEGRLIGSETNLSSGLHALPVAVGDGGVLGDFAALRSLSQAVKAAGFDFSTEVEEGFPNTRQIFDEWRGNAVTALVIAIRAASATLPLDSVIVESRLGNAELSLVIDELRDALHYGGQSSSNLPTIGSGKFGLRARAVGIAMVPFFKMFGPMERDKRDRRAKKNVA